MQNVYTHGATSPPYDLTGTADNNFLLLQPKADASSLPTKATTQTHQVIICGDWGCKAVDNSVETGTCRVASAGHM